MLLVQGYRTAFQVNASKGAVFFLFWVGGVQSSDSSPGRRCFRDGSLESDIPDGVDHVHFIMVTNCNDKPQLPPAEEFGYHVRSSSWCVAHTAVQRSHITLRTSPPTGMHRSSLYLRTVGYIHCLTPMGGLVIQDFHSPSDKKEERYWKQSIQFSEVQEIVLGVSFDITVPADGRTIDPQA